MRDRKRGTVRDLRRENRAAVVWSLYLSQPRSRLELGAATGLSAASVTNVIRELIDEGVVIETGLAESDGGRPRAMLGMNPRYGYVIGVDIGETRTRVGLFDLTMTERAKVEYPLDRSAEHDARRRVKRNRLDRQAVPQADRGGAALQQFAQRNADYVGLDGNLLQTRRVEHVIDECIEPIEIFQHETVEVELLRLGDTPPAERLQIELERRDRALQFVCDAVDKVGLPLIETDLLHGDRQVKHHADQHQHEKRGADGQQRGIVERQQHPTDHERHQEHDHDHAQGDGPTYAAAS